jgi:hypothetical protein
MIAPVLFVAVLAMLAQRRLRFPTSYLSSFRQIGLELLEKIFFHGWNSAINTLRPFIRPGEKSSASSFLFTTRLHT